MVCRDLRHFEVSESGGEVNRLNIDLTGHEQRPEQHRRRIGRWQHGLRLDPPLDVTAPTRSIAR